MIRDTRRRRRRRWPYLGRIEFSEREVRRWIRYHGGFASKEFLEGEVRYRRWTPVRNRRNHYRVFTTVVEGGEKITRVVIPIVYYPNGDTNHPYRYVRIDRPHARGLK